MKKIVVSLALLLLLLLVGAGALVWGAAWWGWQRAVPMKNTVIDYRIEAGSSPGQIAAIMRAAGIEVQERGFVWLARFSGLDRQLKAGAYEARRGDTMWLLLERMANGDMTQARLTFPEGWTFAQMRAALAASADVQQTLAEKSASEISQLLQLEAPNPEGLFFPDTYVFTPGSADVDILRRAALASEQVLQKTWDERERNLPYENAYQALIMASIIEKETGHSADRARVAGVFVNRLRRGMPLQTDPTVIYGLGKDYNGRLRRADLERDTAWNTYTRTGLPPTPIASPGKASLLAALHPEKHDFYYFVARGDGTSEFSRNLTEHNRAVAKYILKR